MRMSDVIAEPYPRSNRHLISRIGLIEGDLLQQTGVDAVVTTISAGLKAEGTLNEAIFAAAGPGLDEFILEHIFRPHPGEVFAVPSFGIAQTGILHILYAVTPHWRQGDDHEDRDLLRCYRAAIQAAREMGIRRLAFAALGTGSRTYPVKRAARLAINGIMDRMDDDIDEVRIVCNRDETFAAFHEWLVYYGWTGFTPRPSENPHS